MLKKGNTCIATTYKILSSPFTQALGAMGALRKQVYIFSFGRPKRDVVHMLFVFHCLDIVWLDAEKKIIGMHKRARPFIDFIAFPAPSTYMIEFPAGMIQKQKLKIGNQLSWS